MRIPVPDIFFPSWWKYILEDGNTTHEYVVIQLGWERIWSKEISFRHPLDWLRHCWCRATGHRGVYWYSSGFEPDMHCRGCGENLG